MKKKSYFKIYNPDFPDCGVSSTVKEIRYNTITHKLSVDFIGGNSIEYINVPETVWERAIKAESIGKFLKADVVGRYESSKLL